MFNREREDKIMVDIKKVVLTGLQIGQFIGTVCGIGLGVHEVSTKVNEYKNYKNQTNDTVAPTVEVEA